MPVTIMDVTTTAPAAMTAANTTNVDWDAFAWLDVSAGVGSSTVNVLSSDGGSARVVAVDKGLWTFV